MDTFWYHSLSDDWNGLKSKHRSGNTGFLDGIRLFDMHDVNKVFISPLDSRVIRSTWNPTWHWTFRSCSDETPSTWGPLTFGCSYIIFASYKSWHFASSNFSAYKQCKVYSEYTVSCIKWTSCHRKWSFPLLLSQILQLSPHMKRIFVSQVTIRLLRIKFPQKESLVFTSSHIHTFPNYHAFTRIDQVSLIAPW
jgi:hypothetical protein